MVVVTKVGALAAAAAAANGVEVDADGRYVVHDAKYYRPHDEELVPNARDIIRTPCMRVRACVSVGARGICARVVSRCLWWGTTVGNKGGCLFGVFCVPTSASIAAIDWRFRRGGLGAAHDDGEPRRGRLRIVSQGPAPAFRFRLMCANFGCHHPTLLRKFFA